MKYEPFVSIVVPLHWGLKPKNFPRFKKDLRQYLKLEYQEYEILLVVDKMVDVPKLSPKIRLLVMNSQRPTGPAEKRDFALRFVKGDIAAFIDDDAYPNRDWLKNAVRHFAHPLVIGVGGPGVTPPENNFWQKIGGYIIESYLCSGGIQNRFYPGNMTFVDDYPAYNLFIKTAILKKVDGYGSTFYGGEDTYLFMKLIKHGKILYDPSVVVYHHRRSFPLRHLKQISSVGIHRGYFFKKFPETSARVIYLLPTGLTLGLFGLIVLALNKPDLFLLPLVLLFASFWLLGAWSIHRHNVDVKSSMIGGIGIIITHITYGIYFIRGLLVRSMTR